MAAGTSSDESIRREARIAGLPVRDVLPSLQAVEGRRRQLWLTAVGVVVLGCAAVTLLSLAVIDRPAGDEFVAPRAAGGTIALLITFVAYAVDKERHLRRLRDMVAFERERSTALAQQVFDYSMVLEAAKALHSVLGLADVVHQTLTAAMSMVGAFGGTIHLSDTADELSVAAASGQQADEATVLRIGQGLAGRAAATRQAQLVDLLPSGTDPGELGRAISVPLVSGDELVGVLSVCGGPGNELTARELHALTLFGEQAAIGLANARGYELQRRRVTRLFNSEDLRAGRLASGTHDLRTPLTSIISCSRMARRSDLPADERAEMLTIMESQSHRLATMIEDLLTASDADLSPRNLNVSALIADVAGRQRLAGRAVTVHAPQACSALADPAAVEPVLEHLLDNAFRYGAAPVQVGVRRHGDDVLVSVWDNGPGIPDALREHVFERGVRLEGESADVRGDGHGLGLAIVRRLVNRAGGKVWADEAPGGGAAFHVTLPAAVTDHQAAGQRVR